MFYQKENAKEEADKLAVQSTVKIDELNSAKEEVRSLQNEIITWEAKYNKLFEQKVELLQAIKKPKINS